MRLLPQAVLLASVFFAGCASGTGSGSPDSDIRHDRNLISTEELEAQPQGSAYQAIQRLRPIWLRSRSSYLASGVYLPGVFLDGRAFGTVGSLREINIASVGEIRYLSAREATTQYGTGYPAGIIFIVLKRSAN
jgi:hypothetical protein